MSRTHLAVIGGGVIGLACAWSAARRDLAVTLIDPVPGSGASDVAAGMLAPVTEHHPGEEDLLRLNLAAAEMYPGWIAELEEESGHSTGYRTCGTLMAARDRDDLAALAEVFELQERLGLKVERLTSRECKRLEPGLAPSVRGGISITGDHQVDPAALVAALRAACEARGVTFVAERADAVAQEGPGWSVRMTSGSVPADRVVVAAGAQSAAIEGLPFDLPVRPVKGQLLRLRAQGEPLPIDRNIRGLDVYLVPRPDGRLIIGATVEERGADLTPTAGAVHDLLRRAFELVPAIDELALEDVRVGSRPGTPDNAPLIGEVADGLFVATGHFRNGILLAPVTAEIVRGWIAGDRHHDLTAFDPARFTRSGS